MSKDENAIQIRTFKAKIRASKPRFMQKVIGARVKVKDAFNARFCSYITMFVPKLTPLYNKPHVMLHVSNGGGSCLMRFKSPEDMATFFEGMAKKLRSDVWDEKFWGIQDISESLITDGRLLLDEDYVDVNAWHEELEGTMDIELVESKSDLEF